MIITVVLLKTIPTLLEGLKVSRGWIQLQPFFLLFKLLGKVFRTMTITKGLWGRATLTMDQKFEIGTPLMRNFLFFSFPSFFLLSFFYCHLILMFALLWDFHSKDSKWIFKNSNDFFSTSDGKSNYSQVNNMTLEFSKTCRWYVAVKSFQNSCRILIGIYHALGHQGARKRLKYS